MSDQPTSYSRAVFHKRGAELELEKVKFHQPKKGEVVIKTAACGISSSDHISQYQLIDDSQQRFPVCPGQVVVGEIALVGDQVDGFKPGMRVGAVMRNGGLGEYSIAQVNQLVEIDETLDAAEACLLVYNCSKIAASYKNNVYSKEDLVVVHGSGGFARLAIDVVKKAFEHENLCLVTDDTRSSPDDYGLSQDRFLKIGSDNDVGKALRKFGAARVAICVDVPGDHLADIFAGSLDDARIVLLCPSERSLRIPTGELAQRGISINGSPYASQIVMKETIKSCLDKKIKLEIDRFPFSDKGVRQAWNSMEKQKWEAPVVVFGAAH